MFKKIKAKITNLINHRSMTEENTNQQGEAQGDIGQEPKTDDGNTTPPTAPAPAAEGEGEQQADISASGVQVPAGPKVPGTDATGKPEVDEEASTLPEQSEGEASTLPEQSEGEAPAA